MSIVLNEKDWVEKMIANHDLGKKPIETLSSVSKYYRSKDYSKREVRKMLDIFLMQCDPNISLVQWAETLDKIAKGSDRFGLIKVEEVIITVPELARIEQLSGKQVKRLAFTLLCVAKYWNQVSKSNNSWVNTADKEIMQMANINTSIKRQSMMYNELRTAGFIRFSKKIDNLNVQVLFEEPGAAAIHIQDFRNLGHQYLRYYGEPYFECSNCGITTKMQEPKRGRTQKYCPNCASEIKMQQIVNSVMQHRNALKS